MCKKAWDKAVEIMTADAKEFIKDTRGCACRCMKEGVGPNPGSRGGVLCRARSILKRITSEPELVEGEW